MTENQNPNKVLTFKGEIKRGSGRFYELFINYSQQYSDLLEGNWQALIRDITYVSVVKEKPRSNPKSKTFFKVSSNFIRSVNEKNESIKTDLLLFAYQNYGAEIIYNPHDYWFYITDKYQTASINFEYYLGEPLFETFNVNVSVLFRRVD
jgi:hypothetical protein